MAPAGRGSRRGGPHSQRGGFNNRSSADKTHLGSRGSSASPQTHFSLSQEARNTERHHGWNSDLKLRHTRIAFISAGTSDAAESDYVPQERQNDCHEPLVGIEPCSGTEAFAQGNENSKAEPTMSHVCIQSVSPDLPMSRMTLTEDCRVLVQAQHSGKNDDLSHRLESTAGQGVNDDIVARGEKFFTDVSGSSVHTGFPPLRMQRSLSPALSDSSEEVVVFAGRHGCQSKASHSDTNQDILKKDLRNDLKDVRTPPARTSRIVIDDPIDQGFSENKNGRDQSSGCMTSTIANSIVRKSLHQDGSKEYAHKKRPSKGTKRKTAAKAVVEAEILADYIANIRSSDECEDMSTSLAFNHRDIGGSDTAEWTEDISSVSEEEVDIALKDAEDWDSADLQDLEYLSTSSEAPNVVAKILSKRERLSGTQYLVVGEGSVTDDARWLPISTLSMPGASNRIREFEKEADRKRLLMDSDVSDEDAQIGHDIQEAADDVNDEQNLEDQGLSGITDEQIAQLLSKQEELGLGSDTVVLFNEASINVDGEDFSQLDGAVTDDLQSVSRAKRTVGSHRNRPSFPSASAFAAVLDQDPYNGFDIMDQDRPSLRKIPKGRRGKLPVELSDSELEQTLQSAWENDRSKKKLRKQQREEVRAQGLLGKKGKLDMKAKYSEGMTIEEAKKEIKIFLSSSLESLSLPPMGHTERKLVHEIANNFKMKSKSIGGGRSRYPVIYKTSKTTQYDEDALGAIELFLSSRRFLPRLDRDKSKSTASGKGRSRGLASAGVSYRDGEIVGATAPELGQDNRGRAMLEKMGWSTGKALGALNNDRGIVQPVSQVVRTTKAGLG